MKQFQETISLLENSQFFYIITTAMDGTYSYVNTNYKNAFSHIDPDVVGKPYHITMHHDDTKTCGEIAAKCFASPEKSFPATIRKHDGKGGYIITQWEYTAIFDKTLQPQGIFCLGYDITEYISTADELKEANLTIEEKDDRLTKIGWEQSHLLRRPLANILGLINILSKMELDQNCRSIFSLLLEISVELDEIITKIVKSTN